MQFEYAKIRVCWLRDNLWKCFKNVFFQLLYLLLIELNDLTNIAIVSTLMQIRRVFHFFMIMPSVINELTYWKFEKIWFLLLLVD